MLPRPHEPVRTLPRPYEPGPNASEAARAFPSGSVPSPPLCLRGPAHGGPRPTATSGSGRALAGLRRRSSASPGDACGPGRSRFGPRPSRSEPNAPESKSSRTSAPRLLRSESGRAPPDGRVRPRSRRGRAPSVAAKMAEAAQGPPGAGQDGGRAARERLLGGAVLGAPAGAVPPQPGLLRPLLPGHPPDAAL